MIKSRPNGQQNRTCDKGSMVVLLRAGVTGSGGLGWTSTWPVWAPFGLLSWSAASLAEGGVAAAPEE